MQRNREENILSRGDETTIAQRAHGTMTGHKNNMGTWGKREEEGPMSDIMEARG